MNWASQELVGLLSYLIPGFLAAWIFFGLTAHPKPSPFERIIQALIFTVVVQGIVAAIEQSAYVFGQWTESKTRWTEDTRVIWAMAVAAALGVILAYFANNDTVHKILRRLNVTRRTSLPSEWFGNFAELETFVVLHLSGERRIYGWPSEWPDHPESGHFTLRQAEWLTEEEDANVRIPLEGVEAILVPVSEVSFVEFMKPTRESEDEQEATDPAPEAN